MAGKGDTYRKVDKKKYDENYERIFPSKREKVDRLRDGIKERAKTFSREKEPSRQEVKRRIRDET